MTERGRDGAVRSSGVRVPVVGVVVVGVPPGGVDQQPVLCDVSGQTLVRRAMDCLVTSGRVDRLAVLFGETWRPDVAPGAILVVHDPAHPLVSGAWIDQVLDVLMDDPDLDGVVPVRPVTDTLKRVGPDGVVEGTADRGSFHVVGSPQAYRQAALVRPGVLGPDGTLPAGPGALAARVRSAGGVLRVVPALGEVIAVVDADDLILAEALLRA
ncbi:MAG: 2-C-methyl-D-erythritol 4-phosphate cytidylyltransferase [Actinomycetota bacterium]|nr:2-C-methyl-D-erythritol 4-phosphate cytidylyltransferase [Actinomycetota bacterium]